MSDGGSVENGSGMYEGSRVDNRGGMDHWGVDQWSMGGVVHGCIVADDALGRHSRGMVKRQKASVGSSQHSAEGDNLKQKGLNYIKFIINILIK